MDWLPDWFWREPDYQPKAPQAKPLWSSNKAAEDAIAGMGLPPNNCINPCQEILLPVQGVVASPTQGDPNE